MAILRLTQPIPISIDARPHFVKIATMVQSPVFGGRVKRVDDVAFMTVKDVPQIVRLGDAVSGVVDHISAAKRELAALVIAREDGVLGAVLQPTLAARSPHS